MRDLFSNTGLLSCDMLNQHCVKHACSIIVTIRLCVAFAATEKKYKVLVYATVLELSSVYNGFQLAV